MHLCFRFMGDLELITQMDSSDSQYTIDVFYIPIDFGPQVFRRVNSPRLQRGTQGSGQSSCNPGHDVIQGGQILWSFDSSPVFFLIEVLYAAMDAEMDRFLEVFKMGRSVSALVFFDAKTTYMNWVHFPVLLIETGTRQHICQGSASGSKS